MTALNVMTGQRLDEPTWSARAHGHAERVAAWTTPHRYRQAHGIRHPIFDFLFTYYSHRPSRLERWHPGPGAVLTGAGATQFLRHEHYRQTRHGVTLDPVAFTAARARTARSVLALLEATSDRSPSFNCFGLHEWAMVYRLPAAQLRHTQLPLRLGHAATDAVVRSLPIRCGHFDAVRFFTDQARPLNRNQPSRETRLEFEQPGCLHTNMDLYRCAYRIDPFIPSELVADCFELAAAIRVLDMRASPYDLRELGYQPVCIETSVGRAEYAREQAEFAHRAVPLRDRLIAHCRELLEWAGNSAPKS